MLFYGEIIKNPIGCHVQYDSPMAVSEHLKSIKGKVKVTITKFCKPRTLRQNRYYWAVMTFIGNELGYEREEMHATFKSLFNWEMKGNLRVVRSTTDLTTLEFTSYFDRIVRECADLDIQIPTPEYYNFTSITD